LPEFLAREAGKRQLWLVPEMTIEINFARPPAQPATAQRLTSQTDLKFPEDS